MPVVTTKTTICEVSLRQQGAVKGVCSHLRCTLPSVRNRSGKRGVCSWVQIQPPNILLPLLPPPPCTAAVFPASSLSFWCSRQQSCWSCFALMSLLLLYQQLALHPADPVAVNTMQCWKTTAPSGRVRGRKTEEVDAPALPSASLLPPVFLKPS